MSVRAPKKGAEHQISVENQSRGRRVLWWYAMSGLRNGEGGEDEKGPCIPTVGTLQWTALGRLLMAYRGTYLHNYKDLINLPYTALSST